MDHINESKETRVVAYTCRYSSGQLIPIFQSVAVVGIKGPLEYLQVSATTLVSLLFISMIPIAYKITNFSLYLLFMLENFFKQRGLRGQTHKKPIADQFIEYSQALTVVNSTCATISGNCRAGEVDPKHKKKDIRLL